MPAFEEEVEAAIEEGVTIETLVSPTAIKTTSGLFSNLECVRNRLGDPDSSGRRRPVPIEGSDYAVELDTLIVAISEDSGVDSITPARSGGIEVTDWNTVKADARTLLTSRPGVFAAGDVITGPNTIIDAIAAGKKAAVMIDHFVREEELIQPVDSLMPTVHLEPVDVETDGEGDDRIETPRASVEWRKRNFAEVEVGLSMQEAATESRRCLRCDLEFVEQTDPDVRATGGHAE